VPIANETMQVEMKSPGRINDIGKKESMEFTVASIAPIALADWANAPARRNIQII
jgi:hypothetical protein